MNRAVSTALTRNRHLMALVFGALLGQIVLLMAQRPDANWQGFGISTVFIAAATAGFVCTVIGVSQHGAPLPRAVVSQQAHRLAGLIGAGLLASLAWMG